MGMERLILCVAVAACGPSAVDEPAGGSDGGTDACRNLECQQVVCPAGGTTRLAGTIRSPAPVAPDPLPNVVVYIPNAAVPAFVSGASCETCSSSLGGEPLVHAVTAADGRFELTNVPAGANIPIVIQSGRWRRQVTMNVAACSDNTLPTELARLPRNRTEGDIPHMAIVTGDNDALECMLAKLVDPAEVGSPGSASRIHLYRHNGNDLATPAPTRAALLADLTTLLAYDAVLLPCAGAYPYTAAEVGRLRDFVDRGGRALVTHHGGSWLFDAGVLYPGMIAFNQQPDPSLDEGTINTSFERGQLFATWLQSIGATTTFGVLPIDAPQWYVDSTSPPARSWVTTTSPTTVQHFTFNTPVAAQPADQCGRVVYSNFHVTASSNLGTYPAVCSSGALTVDEKVIEFMLFDATACVAPDVIL